MRDTALSKRKAVCMTLVFDISQEELPIFLAECSDQMQVLEEGLVRLEREEEDADLLQALFRAAHTLKGSSGMIGHKRMVDLTHALESALDGLRKDQAAITTGLIDACLETMDALRILCDEVVTGKAGPIEIPPLVERLFEAAGAAPASSSRPVPAGANYELKPSQATGMTAAISPAGSAGAVAIRARISEDSFASAARAFQLMMALQEMGEIQDMVPSLAQIESAGPVRLFSAQLIPCKPLDEIRKALSSISEVEWLAIGDEVVQLGSTSEAMNDAGARTEGEASHAPAPASAAQPLGEILVKNGVISAEQLKAAMSQQARQRGPAAVLGKTLVKMGFISQEVLDEAIAEQNLQKKAASYSNEAAVQDRARARGGEKTIRTSVERLDNLMNLVGELITDRNRLYLIRSDLETRLRGGNQVEHSSTVESLAETVAHIGRITDQLQAEVMGIRMLPIANVFNKFPRQVRDLARKAGKQIELVMRGEDTELDRSVIEEITDPLIALLRNAVDHGIEPPEERLAAGKSERGTILITARHEQGRIILTAEDDGRGIDLQRVRSKAVEKGTMTKAEAAALSDEDAINLIFVSGLSTAQVVTDVSGRGVGMDIVRNNIEHLGGSVQVETWPGRGTQFQVNLPLTLAIVPTLLVRLGRGTYAIPIMTVTETLRIHPEEMRNINGKPVILLREQVLPLIRLADLFHIRRNSRAGAHLPEQNNGRNGARQPSGGGSRSSQAYEYIVVVRWGKSQIGLVVDKLLGEQEVVVKSLSSLVGEVPGISSSAILGDGQVTLIIDVQGLFKLAAQHRQSGVEHE